MTEMSYAPMTRLSFEVIGHPEPAGSKRAVAVRRKEGGGWVHSGQRVIDDNPHAGTWKADVAAAAVQAIVDTGDEIGFLEGPLGLAVVFTLMRPKGHYGIGCNAGTVKDSAPRFPIVKPDATKLLRGVEDALTGVVWRDDAQVVEQAVCKRYGEREGARVTVWAL